MRLIDADALKDELETVVRYNDGTHKWMLTSGVYNAVDSMQIFVTGDESEKDKLKGRLIAKMLFEIDSINEGSTYETDKAVAEIISKLAGAYKAISGEEARRD